MFVRRLCADHGDAVFNWAQGRFDDRRDAEEVVAETMVRAWRRHHQYDPERGSERSWIFGIAKNTAVDHFRRSRRKQFRGHEFDDDDGRVSQAAYRQFGQ